MYVYDEHKKWVLTDDGQRQLLRIRDRVYALLETSGAFQMGNAICEEAGDVWEMMACVDRIVELGEIREVSEPRCAGQHRLFISAK